MMRAAVVVLGLAISLIFPEIGFGGAAMIGTGCGFADTVRSSIWPPAKPTFIDPVNRPRPLRSSGQLTWALVVAGIGAFAMLIAYWAAPQVPVPFRLYGFFLGGMGEGTAIGMLLTARRTREAHNRWIAAMSPQLNAEWKS